MRDRRLTIGERSYKQGKGESKLETSKVGLELEVSLKTHGFAIDTQMDRYRKTDVRVRNIFPSSVSEKAYKQRHPTPWCPGLGFSSKRNQSSLEKWLIPRLGKQKMSLE